MNKIDELLERGVAEVIHRESLKKKLTSGETLRVKLGIDPTSSAIHLGRTVPLLKLRDFQQLGHQIIFIVGDFTGLIGDTSDKESERPMLSRESVEENLKTYKEQVGKILDMDRVEFHYNSTWLEALTYREIGEHADQFSVADFIARENIKKRLDAGKRVSLRETLYPLLQGYDSVHVRADVEIGGTDQRFNILAGRVLQSHFGQRQQDIVLNKLINGTDGRKMSSSWGNTIALTMDAEEMYAKIMSMRDEEIGIYFICTTRVPLEEVREIEHAMSHGQNPRDAKMKLAREIVTLYHGSELASQAEDAFIRVFQQKGVPEHIEEIHAPYVESLIEKGVIESKSELRRLIEGNGIHDHTTRDVLASIPAHVTHPLLIRIGKRRFVKLMP